MAIACLGLVTFFPLRPLVSLPSFIARISRSTSAPAEGEYLRVAPFFAWAVRPVVVGVLLLTAAFFVLLFLEEDRLAVVFFPAVLLAVVAMALPPCPDKRPEQSHALH